MPFWNNLLSLFSVGVVVVELFVDVCCFFKRFLLFPPASEPGELGGESLICVVGIAVAIVTGCIVAALAAAALGVCGSYPNLSPLKLDDELELYALSGVLEVEGGDCSMWVGVRRIFGGG